MVIESNSLNDTEYKWQAAEHNANKNTQCKQKQVNKGEDEQ